MCDLDTCIDFCNKLLRGEISASEAYRRVIRRSLHHSAVHLLRQIQSNHQDSAIILRAHISSMGGICETRSGKWGRFVEEMEDTAVIPATIAYIENLIEVERYGLGDYNVALDNDDVKEEIKTVIRVDMKPRLIAHINHLQSLAKALDSPMPQVAIS